MEKFFYEYYKKYDDNIRQINKKYNHSLVVQRLCIEIADSLGIDDVKSEISLTGLYHDIGRFEQWTKYQTFNDCNSIDHGLLSKQILEENKVIDGLKNKEDIYEAIINHNKIDIKSNTNNSLLLSKIVKDADKLDIFNQYTNGITNVKVCDKEVNCDVECEFYSHKLVNNQGITNTNDEVVRLLAFVFDLHYKYSFNYLIENRILDKIYDLIEQKKLLEKYFIYTKKYIEEMISNVG